MGRSRLGVVAALALTLAGRAGAAEITNVATRGEPGRPFDLRIGFRWDRFQERAQITREGPGVDGITDRDELRYSRKINAFVPRVALGVTHDFEVHFEWPYVAGDDREWRFGQGAGGLPSGGGGSSPSTIETNDVNANGTPCAYDVTPGLSGVQCPLFPVGSPSTVYHGGSAGDLKGGIAWGIFDDKEDPTKPFWLVGLDVTFPTASRYDPAGDRDFAPQNAGNIWSSPHNKPGNPAAVGEKVWKWDFQTALSRRIGPIDPYVKAHVLFMTKSSGTYSNCEHAAEMSSRGNPEMNSAAVASCAAQGTKADAKLPWIAGITLGTELVPYENEAEQQRVSLDFRLFGDYTSAARFYNELTDMSGKLHWTDEYLTMGGFFGINLRASKFITLQGSTSISTSTAHWLTGETLGSDRDWPPLDPAGNGITADASRMNPNYDWRYDAPGRRFRISEVANFTMSFAFVLTF